MVLPHGTLEEVGELVSRALWMVNPVIASIQFNPYENDARFIRQRAALMQAAVGLATAAIRTERLLKQILRPLLVGLRDQESLWSLLDGQLEILPLIWAYVRADLRASTVCATPDLAGTGTGLGAAARAGARAAQPSGGGAAKAL